MQVSKEQMEQIFFLAQGTDLAHIRRLDTDEQRALDTIVDSVSSDKFPTTVRNEVLTNISQKLKAKQEGQFMQLFHAVFDRVRYGTRSQNLFEKIQSTYVAFVDAHKTQETPLVPEFVGTTLEKLDTTFEPTGRIAKNVARNIPEISLTDLEKTNFDAANRKVSSLENYLTMKYGKDFRSTGWHGFASLQRILWQDPTFVEALADPLVVKAILLKAKNKNEQNLGSGVTISSLMLRGIADNRLSYLASVSPNWAYKPKGVDWQCLNDMRLAREQDEIPRKISKEYVENLEKGLQSLKLVLEPLAKNAAFPQSKELAELSDLITKASISDLVRVFKHVVKDSKTIEKVTAGAAGASTASHRMVTQAYEVLMQYDELLKLNRQDHTAVFGYGLVSHALDAKHLAAVLFFQRADVSKDFLKKDFSNAIKCFDNLLSNAEKGTLDPATTSLLKARLQQITSMLVGMHGALGTKPEEMIKIFQNKPTGN